MIVSTCMDGVYVATYCRDKSSRLLLDSRSDIGKDLIVLTRSLHSEFYAKVQSRVERDRNLNTYHSEVRQSAPEVGT